MQLATRTQNVQAFRQGLRASPLRVMAVARPQAKSVQATSSTLSSTLLGAAGLATPLLVNVGAALAKDGELGILEGRSAALLHPAMEFFLLGSSLYAAYLGFQWRRTRELGEEIRTLKASIPAGIDGAATPNPAIEQKEQERKAMVQAGYKDKHAMWGSLILASGVGIAIEGCANTFIRTGKLFPGPHLYAGALMVAVWALAAALVPAMQKGNEAARVGHIGLNVINILLFLSQVPTGLEIVAKVFQFTSWP
uniref:Uncharacterized protein n=1 Tax=Chlamydomonas leiostraca TaxID=1034604 RepID=A0A7S0RYM4_9CHLO